MSSFPHQPPVTPSFLLLGHIQVLSWPFPASPASSGHTCSALPPPATLASLPHNGCCPTYLLPLCPQWPHCSLLPPHRLIPKDLVHPAPLFLPDVLSLHLVILCLSFAAATNVSFGDPAPTLGPCHGAGAQVKLGAFGDGVRRVAPFIHMLGWLEDPPLSGHGLALGDVSPLTRAFGCVGGLWG
jgi:hypothetical protein